MFINKTESKSEGSNPKRDLSKKKKVIIGVSLILISLLIILATILTLQIKSNVNQMIITTPETLNEEITKPVVPDEVEATNENEEHKDMYILVLGIDYRENHNSLLTDSIMLLHIISQEPVIKLLSIPRDLLVENSKSQLVKINSIFNEGIMDTKRRIKKDTALLSGEKVNLGPESVDKVVISGGMATVKNKVNSLLDISINNVVIVNFDTITSLVDEVGGIEIDVKRTMKYRATNLNLKPGLQLLNGEEALGYARFRSDDRGTRYFVSDFDRGMQQQEVVKALVEKISSWKNVGKAFKLLDIVSENVQTDMDYATMLSLIKDNYSLISGQSLQSISFPQYYSEDGDVIIPEDALTSLRQEFNN